MVLVRMPFGPLLEIVFLHPVQPHSLDLHTCCSRNKPNQTLYGLEEDEVGKSATKRGVLTLPFRKQSQYNLCRSKNHCCNT